LEFLPGTKILSQGTGHFVFENASDKNSAPLMNAIIKAIAGHIQPISRV